MIVAEFRVNGALVGLIECVNMGEVLSPTALYDYRVTLVDMSKKNKIKSAYIQHCQVDDFVTLFYKATKALKEIKE